MIRHKLFPLFAGLLVVAGACGGDDDATDTPDTTTAASTQAPTTVAATTAVVEETTTLPATTSTGAAPTTAATTSTTVAPTATEAEGRQLRVLVTNDDGVGAEGIDMLVRGLKVLEVDVVVVAPATQQSGQGGNETGGPLTVVDATTLSGFPAKAVEGFPADSVIWALDQGGIDFVPDLVISGINEGQNLGPVIDQSGTVGAARAAAVRNIPSIAVSAGFAADIDYQAAVAAVLDYLTSHVGEIAGHPEGTPVAEVVSINVPSCEGTGAIRGIVDVPLASDLQGYEYTAPSDCASTLLDPADDVQAYFNGYIAVSPTPLQPAA